ncbi:MAG: flagellar biosynthesis protein FlhF, partial [Pseudomonadota bacterium]
MNIQRFTAPTSREALAKARMVFGDGTLILFNRATENGVEVVATAEDALASLDPGESAADKKQKKAQSPAAQPSYQEVASKVEDDATQLAMSTLSFQDYVRERMLRKRTEAASSATPEQAQDTAPQERPRPVVAEKAKLDSDPAVHKPVPARKPQPVVAQAPAMPQGIVEELHAMKDLIEDRFNTLTWLGQARQNPLQSNLMLKLIRAGYSPTLSRTILERMPEDMDATQSVRWVMDVLERNLKTDAQGPSLQEEGGTFALIGATGVGKTTTAAKLAGLCARTHGAGSVGLITLDTY